VENQRRMAGKLAGCAEQFALILFWGVGLDGGFWGGGVSGGGVANGGGGGGVVGGAGGVGGGVLWGGVFMVVSVCGVGGAVRGWWVG
ncbi:hypothetical protein CWI49_03870, partial [Neisseria meningitidis]|uniref:hypothetical protein n=1 Tax=Neisseria meningitidis TaxID=487 RepID=UPI000CC8C891